MTFNRQLGLKDRLRERVVVYQGYLQVTTGDYAGKWWQGAWPCRMYRRPPTVHEKSNCGGCRPRIKDRRLEGVDGRNF